MEVPRYRHNQLPIVTKYLKKRKALVAFLFISWSVTNCAWAIESHQFNGLVQLSKTEQWRSLLQLTPSGPLNPNTTLYLNSDHDPLQQAILTFKLLQSEQPKACDYPARARIIAKVLNKNFYDIYPNFCDDYQRFLNNFPVDELFLIYTSENVTRASSMMGHIMLRADGKNNKDMQVQHGVTFFTELEGVNVAKIMWESLVTGKEGIFQIAPYAPFVDYYVNTEQRNVYEYPLKISEDDKLLIRDAIWEYGQSQTAYYFHTYNCATVTQAILGLASFELMPQKGQWITPLDVVKAAHNAELLHDANLRNSIEWRMQLLSRLVGTEEARLLRRAVETGEAPQLVHDDIRQDVFQYQYVRTYYDFLASVNTHQSGTLMAERHRFEDANSRLKNSAIDIGEFKNPIRSPKDGQVRVGINHQSNDNSSSLVLRLFPVNNSLEDDNREFYGENVLLLNDLQIRINHHGSVYLDHYRLYSMQTITDYEENFNRLSSSFSVGTERRYNSRGDKKLVTYVSGGLGVSHVFSSKAGLYGLVKASAAARSGIYLNAEPELGMYAYLGETKLVGKAIARYNTFNNSEWQYETQLSLTYFVNADISIIAEAAKVFEVSGNPIEVGVNAVFSF